MPLDFLFRRSDMRRADWRALKEPHLEPPPRIEVTPPPPPLALPPPAVAGAPAPPGNIHVRSMSPRQMADWAHEMYMTGWISWDEYRAAIPPELLPGFDATIGALTGEFAEPNRPRDMLREWEERLDFARRYSRSSGPQLKLAERIVSLLRYQEGPRHDA